MRALEAIGQADGDDRAAGTSGCATADLTGAVALVQHGTCTFGAKVADAQAAGASAVIIFNQGNTRARTDLVVGTLGAPFTIPVVGDCFNAVGLASGETPFSGRSDDGPFIAAGVDIPAGGLFTGAEGVKKPSEVQFFGGKAGVAYDPCYHQFCDSLTGEGRNKATCSGLQDLVGNVNVKGLDEMSDAAAHATSHFARRDVAKQPLTDPSAPVTGVATTSGGGGLNADHDHEAEAS